MSEFRISPEAEAALDDIWLSYSFVDLGPRPTLRAVNHVDDFHNVHICSNAVDDDERQRR
ncbi:MAG TPA: hypothetical protein VLW25_12700 [Bryobacteraceae bacterium]|nr:hypothetical protein [Bryobacteraceae bacterium]